MGTGGEAGSPSLRDTPTWAFATVFLFIIAISIFIEHSIHLVCNWLERHRQKPLFEAVQRLKSVLMLLGFMSLLLTVIQRPVARICIPTKVAYSMLPCHKRALAVEHQNSLPTAAHKRSGFDHCQSQGKTSLISEEGINQLSIFIFVLAAMQIVYSVLTMALGRAKIRSWKSWEKETQTVEYQVANDPNRFRLTRQTTFGLRHTSSCTRTSLQLWTKCFFRQFFHSLAKVDYFTLRQGFISAHFSNNKSFDFQKHVERSLEHDFKVVVGIRPSMWIVVVIFLLLDVHGWQAYLWISFFPLTIVLVLGAKIEVILSKMALQLKNQNDVAKGTPLVQPNDGFFWFGHPRHMLTLLHFTLFMNAFEVSFFIWVTLQFGIKSCYHEHIEIIITRVLLAVTVQVLCSYITLPLYALITQMGSELKSAVLEKQTANVVMQQWHANVRKQRQKQQDLLQPSQSDQRPYNSPAMSPSLYVEVEPTVGDIYMLNNNTSPSEVEQNPPQVATSER